MSNIDLDVSDMLVDPLRKALELHRADTLQVFRPADFPSQAGFGGVPPYRSDRPFGGTYSRVEGRCQ
jgi:hypothetical protein